MFGRHIERAQEFKSRQNAIKFAYFPNQLEIVSHHLLTQAPQYILLPHSSYFSRQDNVQLNINIQGFVRLQYGWMLTSLRLQVSTHSLITMIRIVSMTSTPKDYFETQIHSCQLSQDSRVVAMEGSFEVKQTLKPGILSIG